LLARQAWCAAPRDSAQSDSWLRVRYRRNLGRQRL